MLSSLLFKESVFSDLLVLRQVVSMAKQVCFFLPFVLCLSGVWSFRYKRKAVKSDKQFSSQVPLTELCVGSDAECDGNVCCPGFNGSLGRTFPCPNADDDFDGCDTSFKYDLYNASLLHFGNVQYDRLSAATADNDGEALIRGVGYWSRQRLDLKVQSVDSNGNQVPLSENTFKAIKPHVEGRLLRFDFQRRAEARLRFNFGVYEDGVWTPIIMPFLTTTLMDFDCGKRAGACERVKTADHARYETGDHVTVYTENGVTVFNDNYKSNAENNPHSVILNEEQLGIAVGLYFEKRSNFTLHMFNFAWWPRTVLFAGITNLQWSEIYTPAPTPVPTPAPTPSPTLPTPSPTPSPTCPFELISGACGATCSCINSPNYPQNYDANGSCIIDMASNLILQVKDFSTEVVWDALVVNGQNYSGSNGPVGVEATGEIFWSSDGGSQDKGWSICVGIPTEAPTPVPTPSPTSHILVIQGMCEIVGDCVQSPNYPSNYESNQACTIGFRSEGTLHVDDFATENQHDYLEFDGSKYSGLTGPPDDSSVTSDSLLFWSTDYSTTHKGWRMCSELPPSAVGDPHVKTITGDSFDLWRTGWSTFVQIPLALVNPTKLLVRGDVRPYEKAPCAPAFLQQVRINGSWLGTLDISVHSGSLESSNPFSVVQDGGEPMFLQRDGVTEFVNENGVSLRGWISTDEGWGPDAKVELTVGGVAVIVAQHTEGRGESSNSMLDLSVSGLSSVVDPVGGWLGVAGAEDAGEPNPECLGAGAR